MRQPVKARASHSGNSFRKKWKAVSTALLVLGLQTAAIAQERQLDIAGFGAKSGVLRLFGVNSEAAMKAAIEQVNQSGGIKLADGATGKFRMEYYDDRCTAEEGISVVRRIAEGRALTAIGPSCSNVAEPLFGILQKKVDDASDSGLQFPVFTDVAVKGGLAKISEWAFRNVPSESEMYRAMFAWTKEKYPDLKTVYGGVEEDFAHSRATWYSVMKERAKEAGYQVKGESKWLLADTNFATQVRETKAAAPDIMVVGAHAFTTCGFLRELARQRIQPKLIIGLTSSSTYETLSGCAAQAEGMLVPTSYMPINPGAKDAFERTKKHGGLLDLHAAGTYEAIFILKHVIEKEGILGLPDTVKQDRRKLRDGLAKLNSSFGLLGQLKRTPDREALKPFVFVQVKKGQWDVVHNPDPLTSQPALKSVQEPTKPRQ